MQRDDNLRYTIHTLKVDILTEKVANRLSVLLDEAGYERSSESPDYVIAIGGDGTFLRAVKKYENIINTATFIGFKTGHVGYYCNYDETNVENIIEILETSHIISLRLLKGLINESEEILALNEITITNPPFITKYDVFIDGELLENYNGNGLLVCTSTGSTGYNKSLNGAIIDPKLVTLELTEIAPLNSNVYHSIRDSIVFSPRRKIKFVAKNIENAMITCDAEVINCQEFSSLELYLSKISVKTLTKQKDMFIPRIRKTFPI